MILKTKSGKEITCSNIVRSTFFPVLMFYTSSASAGELWNIFNNNAAETERLIAIDDNGKKRVFRNYTTLHSISPTTMMTGEPEIQVWLDYTPPEEDEEEEIIPPIPEQTETAPEE